MGMVPNLGTYVNTVPLIHSVLGFDSVATYFRSIDSTLILGYCLGVAG